MDDVVQFIDRKIQYFSKEAAVFEGGRGIPVGCEGIRFRWKEAILYEMKGLLKVGTCLELMKESLKHYGVKLVTEHNKRRPRDINWQRWEHSNTDFIEATMREIANHMSKKS